jgi:asparaginyl-tRNA synthetase
LHKSKLPLEYLRDYPHLRSRTKLFESVWKLRNAATHALHSHFQSQEFIQIHCPILTSSDCEGGGDAFAIENGVKHFGHPTYLSVSSQLHLEALASSFEKVYSLGPVFRAEKSHSTRHLSEFWMLEAEIAFLDNLPKLIEFISKLLCNVTNKIINENQSDLINVTNKHINRGPQNHLANISKFVSNGWENFAECITYTEAIKICSKQRRIWLHPVKWGLSLQSEHERFLTDCYFDGKPVFVTEYPKEIKPFYMKPSESGTTVLCTDLLVPRIGELIGGSLRIDDVNQLGGDLEWYKDLRRFGSVPHGGFGMGFERYLSFLSGVANVKDLVPFPRWEGSCKM